MSDIVDIDKLVLQIAERLREKATKQGRIPFLSGDLCKSIQVDSISKGIAVVGSNLAYARAVHDGRPAITIKPNTKKNPPRGNRLPKNKKKAALRFKIGGAFVFAKSVTLPAMEGQPFLQEAADEMQEEGFDFLMPGLLKDVSESVAKNIIKGIKLEMVI